MIMNKTFSLFGAAVCLFVGLSSCTAVAKKMNETKQLHIVQKKLNMGKIDAVCNSSVFDVQFVQSDSSYVVLRGDAEVLKCVSLKRDGNVLKIETKNKSMFDSKLGSVLVTVSSPDLVSVESMGTGDFTSKGTVDTDKLRVLSCGTGDVEFSDVVCDAMTVELNGTGDFEAKRVEAISLGVGSYGTGDVDLSLRNAEEASFKSSGSGDISVRFINCGKASYSLSGSGDITLSGDLHQLMETASGSGDVDKSGLKLK